MPFQSFPKDPSAVLDYTFDWTAWLAGDSIVSQIVTVDSGIVKDSDTLASPRVIVWLSGGTAGTKYDVTCRIVTANGRTDERTLTIMGEHR